MVPNESTERTNESAQHPDDATDAEKIAADGLK